MNYIWMRDPVDGRDPRHCWEPPSPSYCPPVGYVHRPAIMRGHNCSRGRSGERACVEGNPAGCSGLHARND